MEEQAGGSSVTPEEAEYFRMIEERFCALRGAAMLLSPRDWNLISGWWEGRIPLSIILESLEEVFTARRRRGDGPENVGSLAYVKPEVLRRWRLHREMSSSRREEREETGRLRDDLRRHLGRVARRLQEALPALREGGSEALARKVQEVSSELRRLRKEAGSRAWNPMQAELALEKMDAEILAAAGAALDEPKRLRWEREAEEALRPHRSRMRPEAFRESLMAVRGRLLRREFGLPRLSLLGED